METKIASRVLCGILLTVVLFIGQVCLGTEKQENSTAKTKINIQTKPSFLTDVIKPFTGIQQYVLGSWTYKISTFILASALSSACSVARRYQVPLLAGTAAGIATYAGCSYCGIRPRGFFAGAAFAGVTSVVAWFFYQIEIKKDLQEIKDRLKAVQERLETLSKETADKVSEKLEPWFRGILRDLNEKFNRLSKQLKEQESNLKAYMNPRFDEISKENKELMNEVNKLQQQVSDFAKKSKQLNSEQTEKIAQTVTEQISFQLGRYFGPLLNGKQSSLWSNFKNLITTDLNRINIK